MDANAEIYPLVRWHVRILFEHAALNFDGTSDGVHDAAKFREDAVAGCICDVAVVPLYRRIQDFVPMRLQLGERAFLVGTHQPAITRHIGRENGREVAFNSRLFQISLPRLPYEKILGISPHPDQRCVGRSWHRAGLSDDCMNVGYMGLT
jgi:hypothetical protein